MAFIFWQSGSDLKSILSTVAPGAWSCIDQAQSTAHAEVKVRKANKQEKELQGTQNHINKPTVYPTKDQKPDINGLPASLEWLSTCRLFIKTGFSQKVWFP